MSSIVDCSKCARRGKVNGLSQETYCSGCIHADKWKKDYFVEVKNQCDGCLIEEVQMKELDKHFWIKDVVNRLPSELVPKNKSWSAVLTAITQLKAERNNAIAESERLKDVIKETIEDNLDLADGENCTLIKLKRSISYDDLQPLTDEEIAFQRWCD